MSSVATIWTTALLWILAFAPFFALLSHLMPCNPGMRWWSDRRAVITDIHYWMVAPLINSSFRILFITVFALALFGEAGGNSVLHTLPTGYGYFPTLPVWQQMLAILLFQDIFLYGMHRLFHGMHLWRYHAIHHATTDLDWISGLRFHPFNAFLSFTMADVLCLMAGFPAQTLMQLSIFNTIYSAMVHANLNWTFGPFRYVFSSPVFHRWHHTSVAEGGSKNFAATFPVIDIVFGTFYMPKGKLPASYGIDDAQFPTGFWRQLAYPFRR